MKDTAVVGEKDAVAAVVGSEKDVVAVVVAVAVEGTRSSKYPNLYSRHPCEYHRLCVREKRNSQLREDTKSP